MSRKNIILQQVTNTEQATQLAENRKTSAEGDFVILSAAKKKFELDIKNLTTEKTNLVDDLDVIKKNIIKNTKKEKEIIESLGDCARKVEGEKKTLEKDLDGLKETINKFNKNKDGLEQICVQLLDKKLNIENQIILLESKVSQLSEKKLNIDLDIKDSNSELDGVLKVVNKNKQLGSELQIVIDKFKADIVVFEDTMRSKKTILRVVDDEISTNTGLVLETQKKLTDMRTVIDKETGRLEEIILEANDRVNIAPLAEKKVQEKTEYLMRIIEKAKTDKLISDFKI